MDDADELRQALESGVELPVRAYSWEEQLQRKRAASGHLAAVSG